MRQEFWKEDYQETSIITLGFSEESFFSLENNTTNPFWLRLLCCKTTALPGVSRTDCSSIRIGTSVQFYKVMVLIGVAEDIAEHRF